MTCYHPKKAFVVNRSYERLKVKKKYKFSSFDVSYYWQVEGQYERFLNKSDGAYEFKPVLHPVYRSAMPCFDSCMEPYCKSSCVESHLERESGKTYFTKFVHIPCGQCLGCRIEYSRQWAIRMMMEKEYSENAWFITLTYDDAHITDCEHDGLFDWPYTGIKQYPNKTHYADLDGVCKDALTLNKKDWQNFMKRLRNAFPDSKLRFFMSAEYGSRTMRPHYHAIIYNLPLNDLVFYKKDRRFTYWNSPTLERLWPFGFSVVAEVDFNTCAYVARYVTKKASGEKAQEKYEKFNIMPEFSLMSRKPGLGYKWFEEHGEDAYESYIITVSTSDGPLRQTPPRYYDKLYKALDGVSDTSHAKKLERNKEFARIKGQNATDGKLLRTDLDLLAMLEDEEYIFSHNPKNKFGMLSRKEL